MTRELSFVQQGWQQSAAASHRLLSLFGAVVQNTETPLVYDTHQPQLPAELAVKSPDQYKVMILAHFTSISVRNDIAE